MRPSIRNHSHAFNLLPETFYYKTRVGQLTRSWIGVLSILTAILFGVAIATVYERQRQKQTYRELAAAAAPLMNLRQQVSLLQEDTRRRERLCGAVETSRPNDDLLQTLASIASSTRIESVLVDSVRIRLPVESAAPESSSTAEILIDARVENNSSQSWLDALAKSKRITTPKIVEEEHAPQINGRKGNLAPTQSLRVRGTPAVTRILP